MEPEHSDDLFKEKLGKYAREPDPHVWDRIRASLDQKKQKRVVPIWWALGGIAAALLLSLLFFTPDGVPELEGIPVTDTRGTDSPETDSGNAGAPNEGAPDTRGNPEETGGEARQARENRGTIVPEGDTRNAATREADSGTSPDKVTPVKNGELPGNRKDQDPTRQGVTAVAAAETRDNTDASKNDGDIKDGGDIAVRTPEKPDGADRNNREGDVQPAASGQLAANIPAVTGEDEEESAQDAKTDKGKSLFEAIEEAEEAAVAEKASGRWSVGTNLAPVYYNSFGDGSPISQNFVSNSKSGTLNFSYGVSVAYEVSDRLSLRSGLNRVDFGYNTNQVAFTSTLSGPSPSSLIRTISYSENARTVVVESTATENSLPIENTTADVNAQTPAREGRMLQEFGYLEVPMELEYRLVDRKLGINLVGGLSSLFLVDNSVSLDSDGATTQIGEATNMNSVSFSTNLGLGVFYNLNSDLQLQMQPMFKYHLNTFTNTAGNFQPYSVGVYSGIRYRF
ncbi:outer membrane beta-barrel protein [Robiginitalea sp. SC105]|uniref:outer membrane beta-barrel protein n=1 Tax=Robiginitalea sp. SC105 TaxID=2762332 RepID=UPI00163AC04C|nr:outer membrane beta-barrel protein [Robiginitalea sp. SC105]MBC2838278.1 outer membrane beta-barrel protein [Robiginitalea sp. SC105]